ncbi:DNA polymerase ligase N-terminal domain-containing protein [Planctomicrobium sp. SH664]|uniref:DNA polymerase ligase N-terminal domain-containing protein n=1 Tax=Planctomicrobium sp. SH664 TaxID=3448125 RepID=UPI003F5CB43B
MPRFVILTHDWPFLHWDLMLESEKGLLTWRLRQEPSSWTAEPIPIEPLPDHRPEYLTYVGPVSGNRGTVTRWDQGTFEYSFAPEGTLHLVLAGDFLAGDLTIRLTSPSAGEAHFLKRSP